MKKDLFPKEDAGPICPEPSFPHYWICFTCATEKGGVWPEGHIATVSDIKCEYCSDKNRKPGEFSAPYVDFAWGNKKIDKFCKANRD